MSTWPNLNPAQPPRQHKLPKVVSVTTCQQWISWFCKHLRYLEPLCDRKLIPLPKAGTFWAPGGSLSLNQLTDMNGKPMALDRKFLLHADGSNPSRLRMLDWEDNKRQVVFNPSRNNGLHLRLDQRYMKNTPNAFGIYYPGGSDWLDGNDSEGDVLLGNNGLLSEWYFADETVDSCGHKCYGIWSGRTDMIDAGAHYLPIYSYARAGYDKDWEWRTYKSGTGGPNSFFKVKFQLVE
jgi:hypothetical protein